MPAKSVTFTVETGGDRVLVAIVTALGGNLAGRGLAQLTVGNAAGVDIDYAANRAVAVE